MPRDYKASLEDILEAIEKINEYANDLTYEEFSEDSKTIDAVIRNLEIIGEASRNIPKEIRSRYSDIKWQRIISLRNVLIHEYFGITLKVIWDIVKNKLPLLEKQIQITIDERS
jgi:uncharacterized protein with HEPN domain